MVSQLLTRAVVSLVWWLLPVLAAAQSLPPATSVRVTGTGTTVVTGSGTTTVAQTTRWLLLLGDSKTEHNVIHPENGQWDDQLAALLTTASGGPWALMNRGLGSQTTASYLAYLTGGGNPLFNGSGLHTTGDTPAAVILNIGINDTLIGPLPDQATFTASYLAIIDYVRTFWPKAPFYLMSGVWARDHDANCATLSAWIQALVASRSNVYAGPDEQSWYKGADDGAAMTYDGIHQSAAGMTQTAVLWKAVLWP